MGKPLHSTRDRQKYSFDLHHVAEQDLLSIAFVWARKGSARLAFA
jgi:hypothetical protein